MTTTPETRYAKTVDGVHIAYQVVGDGPNDLVFVPYDYSNIEANWELPQYASFVRGLAMHARVCSWTAGASGHPIAARGQPLRRSRHGWTTSAR